jgi:hypothetical protein
MRRKLKAFIRSAIGKINMSPIKDVNHFLHDLRSGHLRRFPKISGAMLSAGCAGTWYFQWIEEKTGHRGKHIGIEFYTPKPTDLPGNVQWIANTVGDMSGVGNESCELVFSGENLEHLWPEDVVGFFLESARVLQPGGWLIIDSPNRLVTEPLNWSHPEHTVELTPLEARELAALSGFEVMDVVGLYLCKDPASGRTLPFDPNNPDETWPLPERIIAAQDNPDCSFIWWLTAKKAHAPDPVKLKQRMDGIFEAAWAERKRRFVSQVGEKTTIDGRTVFRCRAHDKGALVFGPYMPLKAGKHYAEFKIRTDEIRDPRQIVRCDVVGNNAREIGVEVISGERLRAADGIIRIDFELPELEFGIQARCIALGSAAIECEVPLIV